MADHVLFVLVPNGASADTLLASAPSNLRTRVYPAALTTESLLSMVRDARDPAATRWLRGMLTAIACGAVLGLATNGVLAFGFDMFGGLLEIALPLGLFAGGFLGGFTAAMTGTHVAVEEVQWLATGAPLGAILLHIEATAHTELDDLVAACETSGLAYERRHSA